MRKQTDPIHPVANPRYWALGALPMALLTWVSRSRHHPLQPVASRITYWLLMIAGMAWQFVVSPGDHVPRARYAALERHPPAYLGCKPRVIQGLTNQIQSLFWWVLPALFFAAWWVSDFLVI